MGKINLRRALKEFTQNATVTHKQAVLNFFKNSCMSYEWVSQEEWYDYKTSDTIFLFGSGPSINDITEEQWEIIKSKNTFGLNFAFLTHFPMTYFYLGYEPSSKQSILEAFTEDIRAIYTNTLWFVPTKVLFRLVHPRIIPEFFPKNPKLACFNLPQGIPLESDRQFRFEDFQQNLVYRGVMGVGLHLADLLGYQKIVLMGVDLNTYHHFFDDHDVMREEREIYNKKMAEGKMFESMIPREGKYRTMDEYYYAVNELYFCPKGVQLYVGNKNNILSPRIPLFPDFRKSE